MRCPLCAHPFGRWRLFPGPTPARPLRCGRCSALLVMGPRTRVAVLVDGVLSAAVFAVAVRVLEAPSWQTVVALVALVLVGVGLDVRLVTLEPVRRA